jgi:hypothetical protein
LAQLVNLLRSQHIDTIGSSCTLYETNSVEAILQPLRGFTVLSKEEVLVTATGACCFDTKWQRRSVLLSAALLYRIPSTGSVIKSHTDTTAELSASASDTELFSDQSRVSAFDSPVVAIQEVFSRFA